MTSKDETLECVLVRSGQDPVVVNLDIEPVEKPEASSGKIPFINKPRPTCPERRL